MWIKIHSDDDKNWPPIYLGPPDVAWIAHEAHYT